MTELPLIFVSGLLGSGHCLGMCGGFALAMGATANHWRENLLRQVVFTLGRVFTYGTLGATVGYAGLRIAQGGSELVNVQAWLALAAGATLIIQGLLSAGVIHWPRWTPLAAGPCLSAGLFSKFFRRGPISQTFFAGVMTGFLPCGLVYAFLALAAASGNLVEGMTRMVTFGAGTAPAMILVGLGSHSASLAMRQRMIRWAAWCIVVVGVISLVRGLGGLSNGAEMVGPACPFCAQP
jgi:sulfite exporter TauE/SafE